MDTSADLGLQGEGAASGSGAIGLPPVQGASSAPPPSGISSFVARYDKLQGLGKTLGTIRDGLEKLLEMGAEVTPADVTKEAGKLVATTEVQPEALAALLADMPEKGEQIYEWLAEHEQSLVEQEQLVSNAANMARHQMGTAAMKELMAKGLVHAAQQSAAGFNPLIDATPPAPQGQGGKEGA